MIEQKDRKFIVYQITNKINKMIYIGMHNTKNINDGYMGSGRNISKAIKEFGLENFEKIILHQFDNKEEMLNKEKELVNKEFIARHDTYNIVIGGGMFNTIDTVTVKDKNGNFLQVHTEDPRYLSGELVHMSKDMILVKDKDGKFQMISRDDIRYLSGELISVYKNMIMTKDKNNKFQFVNRYDPRYLSGELIPSTTGYKPTKETVEKRKIKYRKNKHQQGNKNSQFGTCWIQNNSENKRIKKDKLDEYLKDGWIKGRKMILK